MFKKNIKPVSIDGTIMISYRSLPGGTNVHVSLWQNGCLTIDDNNDPASDENGWLTSPINYAALYAEENALYLRTQKMWVVVSFNKKDIKKAKDIVALAKKLGVKCA